MPLLVGTSGFDYVHWVGRIYPKRLAAAERLGFYATLFSVVELDATFYRLPTRRQAAAWAAQVPSDFRFAVRAPRYLTHVLRLRQPEDAVERLLDRVEPLGDHLGVVVAQLPPDLEADTEALDATLTAFGPGVRVALEPAHPSWFTAPVEAILRAHNAAMCWTDRHGERSPEPRTATWRYVRMQEGMAAPPGCYEAETLVALANRLALDPSPDDDWVLFGNDAHACSPANARTFARLAQHAGFEVVAPA